jgi:hypothetical protein
MGVVAVPLAAFAGAGVVKARRAGLRGGGRAWVLPVALAANAAWCVTLTLWYPRFLPWSAPTAVALGVVALVLTAIRSRPRVAGAGLALGLAAVLLVPAAWSASALSLRYNQPGSLARVGPSSSRPGNPLARLAPAQRSMLGYLTAHRGGAEYLAAIPGWWSAAPYVISANARVMPMGGFTGRVPYPSSARFHRLIDSGRLRYVVLSRAEVLAGHRHRDRTPVGALVRWTSGHCTLVPAAAYGSRDPAHRLYDCGPAHQR